MRDKETCARRTLTGKLEARHQGGFQQQKGEADRGLKNKEMIVSDVTRRVRIARSCKSWEVAC